MQAALNVAHAIKDLAAELAVKCVPGLFNVMALDEATMAFTMQVCCSNACS